MSVDFLTPFVSAGNQLAPWDHNIVGSSDHILLVGADCSFPGATVSGMTYNSIPMTLLAHLDGGLIHVTPPASAPFDEQYQEWLYALVAPPNGHHDIVVSASNDTFCGAIEVTGVDETDPFTAVQFDSEGGGLVGAYDFPFAVETMDPDEKVVAIFARQFHSFSGYVFSIGSTFYPNNTYYNYCSNGINGGILNASLYPAGGWLLAQIGIRMAGGGDGGGPGDGMTSIPWMAMIG